MWVHVRVCVCVCVKTGSADSRLDVCICLDQLGQCWCRDGAQTHAAVMWVTVWSPMSARTCTTCACVTFPYLVPPAVGGCTVNALRYRHDNLPDPRLMCDSEVAVKLNSLIGQIVQKKKKKVWSVTLHCGIAGDCTYVLRSSHFPLIPPFLFLPYVSSNLCVSYLASW